jgi:hypothetical protein
MSLPGNAPSPTLTDIEIFLHTYVTTTAAALREMRARAGAQIGTLI